jgi:hypothetical protein
MERQSPVRHRSVRNERPLSRTVVAKDARSGCPESQQIEEVPMSARNLRSLAALGLMRLAGWTLRLATSLLALHPEPLPELYSSIT